MPRRGTKKKPATAQFNVPDNMVGGIHQPHLQQQQHEREQAALTENRNEVVVSVVAAVDVENVKTLETKDLDGAEEAYGQDTTAADDEKDTKSRKDGHLDVYNDVMEQGLSEDIYSVMSTVQIRSVGFLFGVIVFGVQAGILALVFIDLVDVSDNPPLTNGVVNRLDIPVDTSITVTVAQFLGTLLIVNFTVAEGDLLKGISHLLDGYDPDLLQQNPHANHFKWVMAGVLQAIAGALMILDAFLLMIKATAVIEMCLNFAALSFVQDFDDAAFMVGCMGLLSDRIQKECLHVGTIRVHCTRRRRTNWIRRLLMLLLTITLYIPYGIVASWKLSGRFVCSSLYVQFGDAYGPEWPYFSGRFETRSMSISDRREGRVVYFDQSGAIELSYCGGLKAWTFSNSTNGSGEHCDYFIRSEQTTSYDIMDVASGPWYAATKNIGDVPMDWMAVACNDCNENLCAPDVGQCVNNQCVCNDGFMGLNCEFEIPACKFLGLDRRSKESLPALPFASLFMDNEYVKLEDAAADRFYDRPIYVSYNEEGRLDVLIVFSGRRWIIMGIPQEEVSNVPITSFLDYLATNDPVNQPLTTMLNVSRSLERFQPLFFSTPVDYGMDSHQVDPINVRWVLATHEESLSLLGYRGDYSHDVSAKFICSHCDDVTNPCLNGGVCNATSTYCECPQSYGGFLCEYSYNCEENDGCLNGGTCDKVFKICTDCDIGFYGNLCQFKRPGIADYEIAANELGDDFFLCFNGTEGTCLNGGWCSSNITTCSCPPDFTGDYCEQLSDNSTIIEGDFICANSTCLNKGWCIGEAEECTCLYPYTGRLCEQLFANETILDDFFHCSNITCLNDGYCRNELDPCVCQDGYKGDYCEAASNLIDGHNLCSNETCVNGGYCTSIVEVCSCLENWSGNFCEIPVGNETSVNVNVNMTNVNTTGNSLNATRFNGTSGVNETILTSLRRLGESHDYGFS